MRRLSAAGGREEWLGEVVLPRRVLGISRQPRIDRRGRVWRLGALLLAADGTVHATGTTTRVDEPGRPQHLSSTAERRREQRRAALAGGFEPGDVVNHGTAPLAIDASLLRAGRGAILHADEGTVWVRWGRSAFERTPLAAYLDDQVDLLEHPPAGA